jgi:hypothetical protein
MTTNLADFSRAFRTPLALATFALLLAVPAAAQTPAAGATPPPDANPGSLTFTGNFDVLGGTPYIFRASCRKRIRS